MWIVSFVLFHTVYQFNGYLGGQRMLSIIYLQIHDLVSPTPKSISYTVMAKKFTKLCNLRGIGLNPKITLSFIRFWLMVVKFNLVILNNLIFNFQSSIFRTLLNSKIILR